MTRAPLQIASGVRTLYDAHSIGGAAIARAGDLDPGVQVFGNIDRQTLHRHIVSRRRLLVDPIIRELHGAGVRSELSWPLAVSTISRVIISSVTSALAAIPLITSIPAVLRFLSVEPLLERVALDLRGIGRVIVGGESGPGARPMQPAWVRDVHQQCAAARLIQINDRPRPLVVRSGGHRFVAAHPH
jgi:hypothetical protein